MILNVITEHLLVVKIAVILVSTLAMVLVLKGLNHWMERPHHRKRSWQKVIFKAIYPPLASIISVYALLTSTEMTLDAFEFDKLTSMIQLAEKVAITIAVTWFLLRVINLSERYLVSKNIRSRKISKTTIYIFAKLMRTVAIIAVALIIFAIVGVNVSGLLAFGGLTGAAIALSAKDLLANFFGGIIIYMDKPFVVGDWIRSPDKSIEGTVEYIGWRLCRIQTFEQRPLYIPNALFTSIVIENASRMSHRRISKTISIRHQDADKVISIVEQIRKMIAEHPEVDQTQTNIVNLIDIASSSLNIMLYLFIKDTDWVRFQETQQDVLLKVFSIIEDNDAKSAVPVTSLDIPSPVKMVTPTKTSV